MATPISIKAGAIVVAISSLVAFAGTAFAPPLESAPFKETIRPDPLRPEGKSHEEFYRDVLAARREAESHEREIVIRELTSTFQEAVSKLITKLDSNPKALTGEQARTIVQDELKRKAAEKDPLFTFDLEGNVEINWQHDFLGTVRLKGGKVKLAKVTNKVVGLLVKACLAQTLVERLQMLADELLQHVISEAKEEDKEKKAKEENEKNAKEEEDCLKDFVKGTETLVKKIFHDEEIAAKNQ